MQAGAMAGQSSWSFTCPYEALGLDPGADESSIKRAYRLKCKQFHPDLNKAENAEVKFISIGEAYEFLMNRTRGKELGDGSMTSGNSSAFHDWYWTFRMSRTWDKQQKAGPSRAAGPAGFASQPESKQELQGQIAGLRQRAAFRRRRSSVPSAAGVSSAEAENSSSSSNSNTEASAQSTWAAASGHVPDTEQLQQQQQPLEPVHFYADLPSDSGDPMPQASEGATRQQRFVGNNRQQLSGQLTGMKRKALLKRRMHDAQAQ